MRSEREGHHVLVEAEEGRETPGALQEVKTTKANDLEDRKVAGFAFSSAGSAFALMLLEENARQGRVVEVPSLGITLTEAELEPSGAVHEKPNP